MLDRVRPRPLDEDTFFRERLHSLPFWDALGPVVPPLEDLFFAVADQPMPIAHELGEIPDGMIIVRADGPIYAARGSAFGWTKEIAYLTASLANTRARVVFYTCRGLRT